MILTDENYYSDEADWEYQSVSQYKLFRGTIGMPGCEAMAMAQLEHKYAKPKTPAMMIGSYVDAYFEGTLDKFKAEHPEIISSRGATKGQLKQDFVQAEAMIERINRDPVFTNFMTSGETQKIFTGEISGTKWKSKLDVYVPGKCIIDLKTVSGMYDAHRAKDLGEWLSFVDYHGYTRQMAVYQELVRQNTGEKLPCVIAAVSKRKDYSGFHPEIELIAIEQQKMDAELIEVQRNAESVQMVKDGDVEPIRCEHCNYCVDTKVLKGLIYSSDLVLDFQ